MMPYFTHEDRTIPSDGTSLKGRVDVPYGRIETHFGRPLGESGDGKVQAEWQVQFADGKVATIYDWKEYDTPREQVRDWHIGGHDDEVVFRIQSILGAR
jgi:hypothetical protein